MLVLVELQPQIAENIRGVVEISDRFDTSELQVFFIQASFDIIVAALLPVFGTGSPACGTVFVGRGQRCAKLLELVSVVGVWIVLDVLCIGR